MAGPRTATEPQELLTYHGSPVMRGFLTSKNGSTKVDLLTSSTHHNRSKMSIPLLPSLFNLLSGWVCQMFIKEVLGSRKAAVAQISRPPRQRTPPSSYRIIKRTPPKPPLLTSLSVGDSMGTLRRHCGRRRQVWGRG